MATIETLDQYEELAARAAERYWNRELSVRVGMASCGLAAGALSVYEAASARESPAADGLTVSRVGCRGSCMVEPMVELVRPDYHLIFHAVTPEDVNAIIDGAKRDDFGSFEAEGRVWQERQSLRTDGAPFVTRCGYSAEVPELSSIPFYRQQKKIITRNCGLIEPFNIGEALARESYAALVKVLRENDPESVIQTITESGLRGRGGAGFPTGRKWASARSAPGDEKYVFVNADEGDPGAFMDRSVLESDPHAVLEGMTIGAFAIGAARGILYIRAEYPLAIQTMQHAIEQARQYGFQGDNILGTPFSFDVSIKIGAGAFVCGEETALIASAEGGIGEPRPRPPYPSQEGYMGKPTVINNVKTWSAVAPIVRNGAEWFAGIGSEESKGTAVFCITGAVRNTGLIEVPMGTRLEDIVFGIGGGAEELGRKIKAVQTGGPSGGCLPRSRFDLAADYEHLTEAGAMMGSGGMIVVDDTTCMVDLAKFFLGFTMDESCGKCTPCREGTRRMHGLLEKITRGEGEEADIDLLQELATYVKDASLCGLGITAPNPVISTLNYFRDEYERHIIDKRCDAFVCSELVGAPCQSACPLGTEAWRYVAHIARGEYEDAYHAIREANPFPSVCARVCDHPCEKRCRSGTTGGQAIAIRALKRFITDRVDALAYRPERTAEWAADAPSVAVVGSGPAGLTAAHYLSLKGYEITVLEADAEPGGMLVSGIPSYRLPREQLRKEIGSLIDENVTVRCNTALGRDVTIDGLFEEGHEAVFLAMGAHKSRRLNVEGEDLDGVYPAVQFLKAFNLRGEVLACGRVGVVGGGDSAIDAARVALRQEGVEGVTVFYRRTREEMPALKEEIEAAVQEGIELRTLVSPTRILSEGGRLTGFECIKNEPGEIDASGRRTPVPVPGTEEAFPLDNLIVTIGDVPDIDYITDMGIEATEWGTVRIDENTLATNRPGVFAGGDVVTGPNTVVDAIAAGKTAAVMIDRFLRGEILRQPAVARLPEVYVEPAMLSDEELSETDRAESPTLSVEARRQSFDEVEMALSVEDVTREARRCLRCDLEFTETKEDEEEHVATNEEPVLSN